jgi:hypothetical protein
MHIMSNFDCSAHLFNVCVWAKLRRYSKSCDIEHWMIWKALLTGNRLIVDVVIKRVKYWYIFFNYTWAIQKLLSLSFIWKWWEEFYS